MTAPDASDPLAVPAEPATGPTLVFERQSLQHTVTEDVLGLLTGTFVVALGLALLRASDAVTGGTAGLAILVDFATSWPFWLVYAAVNLPFAALAIWKKGWDFTLRTMISIGLVSAFSVVTQLFFPIGDIQPVFGVVAGNVLAGVGLLILFRHRASLGGVNVIALVVQERWGLRAGWIQLAFDTLIIALALLVVPWPNVLLSAGGAIVLNVILALNHRPGRYIGR